MHLSFLPSVNNLPRPGLPRPAGPMMKDRVFRCSLVVIDSHQNSTDLESQSLIEQRPETDMLFVSAGHDASDVR